MLVVHLAARQGTGVQFENRLIAGNGQPGGVLSRAEQGVEREPPNAPAGFIRTTWRPLQVTGNSGLTNVSDAGPFSMPLAVG
jgi:hypothetical protein